MNNYSNIVFITKLFLFSGEQRLFSFVKLILTHLARWPGHLASPQNMDVNMENLLASIFTIIDHYPKPLSQILFCSNFSGNYQQMTQQLEMKGESKEKKYNSINMILVIGINQERQ